MYQQQQNQQQQNQQQQNQQQLNQQQLDNLPQNEGAQINIPNIDGQDPVMEQGEVEMNAAQIAMAEAMDPNAQSVGTFAVSNQGQIADLIDQIEDDGYEGGICTTISNIQYPITEL